MGIATTQMVYFNEVREQGIASANENIKVMRIEERKVQNTRYGKVRAKERGKGAARRKAMARMEAEKSVAAVVARKQASGQASDCHFPSLQAALING